MTHDRNKASTPWRRRRPRRAVALAALLVWGATLFAALAPRLDRIDPRVGSLVRGAFSRVCHQLPSRSFGGPEQSHALCARCEGLYAGCALALALAATWGRRRDRVVSRWLLLLMLPCAIDALVRAAGAAGLDSLPRFLVALPAGFAAGAFLSVGIADLSLTLARRRVDARAGSRSRAGALAENPHG